MNLTALVSIVIAVFVTMVGVGVLHPGGSSKTVAINQGFELSTAVVAVMDIVMAYGTIRFSTSLYLPRLAILMFFFDFLPVPSLPFVLQSRNFSHFFFGDCASL